MVCVLRWGACPVKNGGLPHAGRRQRSDGYGLIGVIDVQDKLCRDGVVEAMRQQTDTAMPVVCMRLDIRLVNQQRCLAHDQQRCEYPVTQAPSHRRMPASTRLRWQQVWCRRPQARPGQG